ncbi:NAD-dependent epimerase/dehydratase family protein [Pinibacter soli]|uniref:NAD-dependent epimerase/dehydratase family protein n=1 Tax=Pinibacter soli TaxID=3044211 RepID=A0ABT6RCS0_9BACT|nr:NAD-dependent epimerase/dehydratase family protein [Pinibacter soli]MDI3320308.1 NAD-dependent epimerase/dehydratase family protein [Pinibacter soli]
MVLVTGGTGFLGAYIIKHLVENGYPVRAIKRASSKIPFFLPSYITNKVEWVEADILDVIDLDAAMKGIDTVVHSAAMVSFDKNERTALYQTNVEGTANVVNVALENNIRRVIHISSVAALGRTKNGEQVNEEKEWKDSSTNTHYAISKYKGEMEVWRAIAEGMNGVILNPSTILGVGDWNSSSIAIFKSIYNEFPYYTDGVNGFVDVEDVARAVVQLMQSEISGQRFIISSENYSFKKLFDLIAEGFQKKKPSRLASRFMGQIAWRVEALKSFFSHKKPLLTKETAKIAQSKTYFDNSKILKALPGFQFATIEETVKKSCAKYLEQVRK